MEVLSESAGTSELSNEQVHKPAEFAVTVLTTAPQVTATDKPASDVPVTVTPADFSAVLTRLSEATALICGV